MLLRSNLQSETENDSKFRVWSANRGHATLINLVSDVDSRIIGRRSGWDVASDVQWKFEVRRTKRRSVALARRLTITVGWGSRDLSVGGWSLKGCAPPPKYSQFSGTFRSRRRRANLWRTDPWEIAFVNETVCYGQNAKLPFSFSRARALFPGAV